MREATGDRQKYGVGQPMSSSASDTIFAYMMFLNAFDVKLVDEQGNLTVDDPKTREGMIKALDSYTKPFLDGCVPPGAVNWQDSDNNVNFKNQITVMVPNPSLSIPASEYAEQRALHRTRWSPWSGRTSRTAARSSTSPRSRPR